MDRIGRTQSGAEAGSAVRYHRRRGATLLFWPWWIAIREIENGNKGFEEICILGLSDFNNAFCGATPFPNRQEGIGTPRHNPGQGLVVKFSRTARIESPPTLYGPAGIRGCLRAVGKTVRLFYEL